MEIKAVPSGNTLMCSFPVLGENCANGGDHCANTSLFLAFWALLHHQSVSLWGLDGTRVGKEGPSGGELFATAAGG